MHSTGLSYKIFLTKITGCVQSVAASVRDFSKGNLLDVGSDGSKLVIRGIGIVGQSIRNLHHGFGVSVHASSLNGS